MTDGFTRRDAIGAGLFCAAAAGYPAIATGGAPTMDLRDLERDIRHYAGMGLHRTGWPANRAAAEWLAKRLQAASFDVTFDDFSAETISEARVALSIDGKTFDAALQWRPPRGNWQGTITAPLAAIDEGFAGSAGKIAVRLAPAPAGAYWTAAGDDAVSAMAAAGCRALVMSVDTPSGDLFLYNRATTPPDLSIPVVVIQRRRLEEVAAAAGKGALATLTLSGTDTTVACRSVIARKSGRGPVVVVSTPLSGWFGCGAERGAGIALMLALARRAGDRPLVFLGTTGHEIGHIGMERALKSIAPAPNDTLRWIHLGSSIAAKGGDARAFASADLSNKFVAPLSALDIKVTEVREDTPGETGNVARHGYRSVLGFAGTHPTFHTPSDDGSAVDVAKLAKILDLLPI